MSAFCAAQCGARKKSVFVVALFQNLARSAQFAHISEPVSPLFRYWKLAAAITAQTIALASCTATPMTVTEMSAALSTELASASAEASEPVALAEGFSSAVARAVQANAGYRASLALE